MPTIRKYVKPTSLTWLASALQIKPILTPEYVIVGKSVMNAEDMEATARQFREMADR